MTGQQGTGSAWAICVASIGFLGALSVGASAVAGQANAEPVPVDPAVPVTTVPAAPPAPPPLGAPPVPPVPGDAAFQQPGQLGSIGEIFSDFSNPGALMDNMFPLPAAPPTPVREMPMGAVPPPIDPRFLPAP
ncbi:hypothetical protein [Mycobacterium sp.]|uniref:hypothetical protein n=1 Tax=Mycobacterium sp. TaxID=1785 RepID=UPI002D821E96|nr:hypothetical protein [Mycobacterium sp.]